MSNDYFDWRRALAQLFGATVNQQTIQEAVDLMISISLKDLSYHDECMTIFSEALRLVDTGDYFVIECINKSGYQVTDLKEARELLIDFKKIYLENYRKLLE